MNPGPEFEHAATMVPVARGDRSSAYDLVSGQRVRW